MKRVFLSLGSNVGNRSANIRKALETLAAEGVEIHKVSSFYRTEPVDFRQQPWFINCAVEAATELLPMQLLKAAQRVELSLGRRRTVNKGPRTIDIDILLYEHFVVRSAALKIPHPGMTERRFVLVPLCEIAAGVRHPITRLTVQEMLNQTADCSQVVHMRPQDEDIGV